MAIEEYAVRREMILPVDRDTAWAALCDADELATWIADEVELEIREGAEGMLRWHRGVERHTVVEEVQESRRISLQWCEPGGEPSIVELTLDDVPGGTRVVVIDLPLVMLRVAAASFDETQDATRGPQMVMAATA